MLRSLALRLSEMALKAAFKPLTDALGGGLASLFSGGVAFAKGGVLRSPLPVPFAQGGVIRARSPSPSTATASASPASAAPRRYCLSPAAPTARLGVRASAGGAVSITFNVTTPDADSFRRSETQIAALLARAVGQGQRNL